VKRPTLLAAALSTALAVSGVLAGAGSADHPGSQTRSFVERNNLGSFEFVDHPPRSRGGGEEPNVSPGDVVVGSNRLYDASNERRVGRFFFECTAMRGGRRFGRIPFHCDGVFELRRGTIHFKALVRFNEDPIEGAITGGSGVFEAASGGVTFDNRRRTSRDTIHFDTD
jgi:hypothetical protein